MQQTRSQQLFEQAQKYIPGGVNSPARAWTAVGGEPLFIARGEGSRVWDVDGNEYIDYLGSWGPLILGHAHPSVVMVVREVAAKGTSFGAPTEAENELARMVIDAFPSMDMVRMVNSGTEAVMSALRLARGLLQRHQHLFGRDALLLQARDDAGAIVADGRERLVQFVRHAGGHLAHGAEAHHVGEFRLVLAGDALGLYLLRYV